MTVSAPFGGEREGDSSSARSADPNGRPHEPADDWFTTPDDATAPLREFLEAERKLVQMITMHHRQEEKLNELGKALHHLDNLDGEKAFQPVDSFRRYGSIWTQLLLTKSVDYYLVYVAKVLTLIFISRPETLRSSAQVSIEYVLRHESMQELIRSLADDQVNQLAYKGMRDLAADVKRRTGIALFNEDGDIETAVEFVELRNISVHNNGVINRIMARKLPNYEAQIGKEIGPARRAGDATFFFVRAAQQFDECARKKFEGIAHTGIVSDQVGRP